jgi:hypothetical protein
MTLMAELPDLVELALGGVAPRRNLALLRDQVAMELQLTRITDPSVVPDLTDALATLDVLIAERL